jgi:hypothetical protein
VALAVKGFDLHHSLGHYLQFDPALRGQPATVACVCTNPFSARYGPGSLGADVHIACVSGTHRRALASQCETGLLAMTSRPELSSAIDP